MNRWPAWAWPRPSAWSNCCSELKKDHAMLLVEHDMDAIFALADHLTVMVNGQVIASGSPAAVRADRGVQAAYLGEEH
jgi:branched-chain amino acid transport system ATP-binding protein